MRLWLVKEKRRFLAIHTASASPSETVRCVSSPVEAEAQPPEEHLSLREAIISSCEIEKAHINELYPLVDKLMMNDDERIVVSNLSLRGTVHAGLQFWNLSLFFRSPKAYSMWKTCFTAAFHHLGLAAAISSGRTSVDTISLTSTMNLDEMQKILEYLKPLSRRSFFEGIFLCEETDVSFQTYGDFLNVASVKTIDFWSPNNEEAMNLEPHLNLIRKIEPISINYFRIVLTPDLANFLVNIADITESIYITHWSTTMEDPLPISILKEILKKRCHHLHFADGDGSFKYSQAHVAELIQFLKESDKRVSLLIPIASDILEGRIGDYILQFGEKNDTMLIKHCEMDLTETDELFVNYHHSEKHSGPATTFMKRSLTNTPSFDPPPKKRKAIEPILVKNDDTVAIRQILETAQALLDIQKKKLLDFEKELKTEKKMKIEAETLCLRRSGFEKEIALTFSFTCSLQQRLWTAFFIGALSKIGAGDNNVFTGNRPTVYNSHTLSWTQSNWTIDQVDLSKLAMLLKTLAVRTTYNSLELDANHVGMINFCVELVEPYHVNVVHIRPWRFTSEADNKITEINDFTPWTRMVGKIRPIEVNYTRVRLTTGLMKFLLNVAEVAQAIRVMSRSSKFHSGAYPISFIHKLFLSSKCTSVTFYDNVTKFTVDETEALIQFFHHTERKLSFTIEMTAALQEMTIGEYTFETTLFGFNDNEHMLSISHNDQWCPSE